MNSLVKENLTHNIFIYKLIDTSASIKKSINNNFCWFCNAKCSSYVQICENCKYEKYEKKRKNKEQTSK